MRRYMTVGLIVLLWCLLYAGAVFLLDRDVLLGLGIAGLVLAATVVVGIALRRRIMKAFPWMEGDTTFAQKAVTFLPWMALVVVLMSIRSGYAANQRSYLFEFAMVLVLAGSGITLNLLAKRLVRTSR